MAKHKYDKRVRRARWLCRCSRRACQARRTFKIHPDLFTRKRYCGYCGNSRWRLDWYRMKLEKQFWMRPCRCAASHYPHRASWCAAQR